MKQNQEKNFKKYFFWAFVLVLAIISYYIIQGFITAIISAFVISYLLLPLHKLFCRKINQKLSAFIIILIIFLIIFSLGYFVISNLYSQGQAYLTAENIDYLSNTIPGYIDNYKIPNQIINYLPKVIEFLGSLLLYILSMIPGLGFTIFLTLFISYFLLADWDKINNTLKKIIPFTNKVKIIKKISDSAYHIIYGTLLIAIIEFFIALIGFKIAGLELYFFLAFLVAIAAFIPLIGASIIWIPACLVLLIQGNYFAAIIILITGIIISVVMDNIVSSIIIGNKAKINPVIRLLGVLGGVGLFGFFGFIIGPLILSIFINFLITSIKKER